MHYQLYDLTVTTIGDPATFNCGHKLGEGLIIAGENLAFKKGTKQFSHYVLAALMPYVAAKQRAQNERDWMFFESDIACPDPLCGARFRFERSGKTNYEYSPKR